MKRTYLALAGLSLAVATAPAVLPPLVRAAGLFEARPVDPSRFAVLAKPVGSGEWSLLVLEQLRPGPACWQPRSDGLVDPSLNRFDFTGICARYLDSNGYSLRAGDQDLGSRQRLRVQQQGNSLQLQALDPDQGSVLVVGQAPLPRRDRDGFVALQLDPGWELQRRSYGGQTLNHLYFANATPLPELLARSSTDGPLTPPPPTGLTAPQQARAERGRRRGSERLSRLEQALNATGSRQSQPTAPAQNRAGGWSRQAVGGEEALPLQPAGRAVALQVIPFQE